jgi:type I restriction enzyme, S subunit
MNLPRLGTDKARDAPFAVPPFAEQQRIVRKVDELMALCDALAAGTYKAIEAHELLVETLLAALTNSRNAEEIAENWGRVETNFDTLFTTTASVDQLKQTLLQLAATGKLVPQDPNDKPASALLKRIAAEKARQVSEGRLNESRYSHGVNSIQHAFELPKTWKWTTLAELSTKITDGTHQTPSYVDDGIPFLSVKDMSDGYLNFTDTRFISDDEHSRLFSRCNPEYGDLLITKVGTTGIPVIVDVAHQFSLFVSVALVKAPWTLMSVNYLYYAISSPFVKAQSAWHAGHR